MSNESIDPFLDSNEVVTVGAVVFNVLAGVDAAGDAHQREKHEQKHDHDDPGHQPVHVLYVCHHLLLKKHKFSFGYTVESGNRDTILWHNP